MVELCEPVSSRGFHSSRQRSAGESASWKSSKGKRAVSEISLLKGVESLSLSLKLQTRERERENKNISI